MKSWMARNLVLMTMMARLKEQYLASQKQLHWCIALLGLSVKVGLLDGNLLGKYDKGDLLEGTPLGFRDKDGLPEGPTLGLPDNDG